MKFRLHYFATRFFATFIITVSLSIAFSVNVSVQSAPVAKRQFIPVMVQEASSQEFQQDRNALRALAERGDLSAFVTAVNKVKDKWLAKDKLSYYCTLSAVCADLTTFNFGLSNYSEAEADKEKYVMEALDHDDALPLGMKAYFVGQLVYIPGHGLPGPTGEKWSRLRTVRTSLLLQTWGQLHSRLISEASVVPVFPHVGRQFVHRGLIVDGVVSPNNITDAKERAKYIAATEKYIDDQQIVSDQNNLRGVISSFDPRVKEHIIMFYSSSPYDTDELEKVLNKSQIAPDVGDQILLAVKENIQRSTATIK